MHEEKSMPQTSREKVFVVVVVGLALIAIFWMLGSMLLGTNNEQPVVEHSPAAAAPNQPQCAYSAVPEVSDATRRWVVLTSVFNPPKYKQWGVTLDQVNPDSWWETDRTGSVIVDPTGGTVLPEYGSLQGSYALWVYYCDQGAWTLFGEYVLPKIPDDRDVVEVQIKELRTRVSGDPRSQNFWWPPQYAVWTRVYTATMTRHVNRDVEPDTGRTNFDAEPDSAVVF